MEDAEKSLEPKRSWWLAPLFSVKSTVTVGSFKPKELRLSGVAGKVRSTVTEESELARPSSADPSARCERGRVIYQPSLLRSKFVVVPARWILICFTSVEVSENAGLEVAEEASVAGLRFT